ncbi:MAG: nucleoside recognition domain-containing protein [candidate division WOR-3 bacterium]
MRSWAKTILLGGKSGGKAWARLMTVITPVYTGMAVLKFIGILPVIAGWFRPAMKYFGLPGDAALALVLGNFLNLYSAIGVIASLKLTAGPLTVLALMLLFSHSQLLESSVFFQIRTKYGIIWAIRLVVSLAAGYGLHFLLAPVAPAAADATRAGVHSTLSTALVEYASGLASLALKMLLVLVAIFILLEVVRRLRWLSRSLALVHRVTGFMGFSREAGLPLLAGVVFGIVFGAGLITSSVEEQALDRKQVLLVSVFLALCHGIIEDTGLMLVLGADPFWISVPRLVLAIPAVILANWLYEARRRRNTGAAFPTTPV